MKSMTGFAVIQGKAKKNKFRIEIKSVNHRFCEIGVRLPPRFTAYEHELQNLLRKKFARGKFDVYVRDENNGLGQDFVLDVDKIRSFLAQVNRAKKSLKLSGALEIRDILTQKECYTTISSDELGRVWSGLKPLVNRAVAGLRGLKLQLKALLRNIKNDYKKRLMICASKKPYLQKDLPWKLFWSRIGQILRKRSFVCKVI